MLTVIWKFVRSIFGAFLRLLYPLKRLICRRRKLSTPGLEPFELISIGTGDGVHVSHSFGGLQQKENEPEIEMEPWDSWGGPPSDKLPSSNYSSYPSEPQSNVSVNGLVMNNQDNRKPVAMPSAHNSSYSKMVPEPEPEPEINFFQDMTPSVVRQKKFLIRKKEQDYAANDPTSSFSSRLAMGATLPIHTQELDTWDDNENAWGNEEAAEDLTWEAEEAIREKRRKERQERQMEQQRRKQKKEEMRGMKGSSHLATKIS